MAEVELDIAEPVAHLRAGGKLLAALRRDGLAVTARQSRELDLVCAVALPPTSSRDSAICDCHQAGPSRLADERVVLPLTEP